MRQGADILALASSAGGAPAMARYGWRELGITDCGRLPASKVYLSCDAALDDAAICSLLGHLLIGIVETRDTDSGVLIVGSGSV